MTSSGSRRRPANSKKQKQKLADANVGSQELRSMDASSSQNLVLGSASISVNSPGAASLTNFGPGPLMQEVSNSNVSGLDISRNLRPHGDSGLSGSESSGSGLMFNEMVDSMLSVCKNFDSRLNLENNPQHQDTHFENEIDGSGVKAEAADLSAGQINSGSGSLDYSIIEDVFRRFEHLFFEGSTDPKNVIMSMLIHKVKRLKNQLKERKEWAQEKAMQAAKKLGNDLVELQKLRMERDEMLNLKPEKQTLDQPMKQWVDKKYQYLALALVGARRFLEETRAKIDKLEHEQAELKAELQAARLSESEWSATFQRISKMEKKSLKRVQALENQICKIQDDLYEHRGKVTQLQQELVNVEDMKRETEAKLKQEVESKNRTIREVEEVRRARNVAEATARRKEEAFKRKIEMNSQCYEDDIKSLEQVLAQLRTDVESSKQQSSKEPAEQSIQGLQECETSSKKNYGNHWLCRICSKQEVSILFLPCAHQVVCVKCNDLHKKKGTEDCPSCNTPIQQRILIYGQSS